MSKELYTGPVPDGFIRITPVGEMGTVTVRAACVHAVLNAPSSGALLNVDGVHEIEYVTYMVGIFGGKRFSFSVQEDTEDIMQQLHAAAPTVVLQESNPNYTIELDEEREKKDPYKIN